MNFIGVYRNACIARFFNLQREGHRDTDAVILQATISKTGTIENHVISGPLMLQEAAVGAVKTWCYQPYLLNGSLFEVETAVNVVFTMGR